MKLTEHLAKAGRFMGIPIIDHVIVGDGYFGFGEKDMLLKCGEDFSYVVS